MVDIETVANFHIRALERIGIIQVTDYGIESSNFQVQDCRFCPLFRLTEVDEEGMIPTPKEGVCVLTRTLIKDPYVLHDCQHLETARLVDRLSLKYDALDCEISDLQRELDETISRMKKLEESYDRFSGVSCL